tara:strand:- start:25 stop:561 length:537 start_codon:yes stop_codon:yes gene_type:complete
VYYRFKIDFVISTNNTTHTMSGNVRFCIHNLTVEDIPQIEELMTLLKDKKKELKKAASDSKKAETDANKLLEQSNKAVERELKKKTQDEKKQIEAVPKHLKKLQAEMMKNVKKEAKKLEPPKAKNASFQKFCTYYTKVAPIPKAELDAVGGKCAWNKSTWDSLEKEYKTGPDAPWNQN